jgi:PHD/YefM family antitoxin component YafN of YafNO toxin-antitoxin module
MKTLNINTGKSDLNALVDDAVISREPIQIIGKNANAVLLAETDWLALQETLYLLSIPKMRESIVEGLNTPVQQCKNEIDW